MAEAEQKNNEQNGGGGRERTAPPGLIIRSARYDEERKEQALSYGFKGGIIAFVDHDGAVYITPGTRMKLDLLGNCGFSNPRPQIDVPCSDGSVKSKRYLKKNLPRNEIRRTLEENRMPKLDGKVYSSIVDVNLNGLRELPTDFLDRCVAIDQKYFLNVGLSAAYRGVLSFTDWSTVTWVTPFSESKQNLLEQYGYQWVGSMVKVPYSLADPENARWLAENIPAGEWTRCEQEVEQWRAEEKIRLAKQRIEKLGLKELPEELMSASALCEENYNEYAGMCGSHNGILGFTDAVGETYVTPATRPKLEVLKEHGYQFMGSAIRVPHSLKTQEDVDWLQEHIAEEHWEEAKRSARNELQQKQFEQAERLQRKLGLGDLPEELTDRSILTDKKQPAYVGQYFIRNNILGYVEPSGLIYITPSTKRKIDMLQEVKYSPAQTGFPMPYSDGTSQDIEYIQRHLSSQEIEESKREREEESRVKSDAERKKVLDKAGLKKLPKELTERSVATEEENIELIGTFCSRNGVTCFVAEDGLFHVTPTVPWKEAALADAGYRAPEMMVRVPYGSGTEEDRMWLETCLPAGELELSAKELADLEQSKAVEGRKKLLENLGIESVLPEELSSRAACTEKEIEGQIGHYYAEGNLLGIVGPDAAVWVTPSTPSKLEALKKANYKYATTRIVIPHSSDSNEDVQWLEMNLPEGEQERSIQEIEQDIDSREEHLAADIADQKGLKELDSKLIERSVLIEKINAQHVGGYFIRRDILFFIDEARGYYITPLTEDKVTILVDAGYSLQEAITDLPYSKPDDEDIETLNSMIPEEERERCRQEEESKQQAELQSMMNINMEKHGLKPLPDEVSDRSADSGFTDAENIGRIGIFRGVMAFVVADERVMVTWYTPDKQDQLEKCGFTAEGRLPIKVPYAMRDPQQREWLMNNLPETDEEEEISVEENDE
jgi:hypothetical protein